jgi:hypothetical protein
MTSELIDQLGFDQLGFHQLDFVLFEFDQFDFDQVDFDQLDFEQFAFDQVDFDQLDCDQLDFDQLHFDQIDFFSKKTNFAKFFSLMSKILLSSKQIYILYLNCGKMVVNCTMFSTTYRYSFQCISWSTFLPKIKKNDAGEG